MTFPVLNISIEKSNRTRGLYVKAREPGKKHLSRPLSYADYDEICAIIGIVPIVEEEVSGGGPVMPAETSISVSWETKHRLEAIVAGMTSERAERQERGRKVSMDDAVRRALGRSERAEDMAIFIEAVQEQIDQECTIDRDLWDELRGDLMTRGDGDDK